jgi:pimeloyl-ACP methyl ester carboxylesterase
VTSWHLIGVVVTAVIFYYIWPERDRDRANRPPGMNSSSTVFCSRWQYLRSINSLVVIVAFCGCASHLAVVKTKPAQLPKVLVAEVPLESAERYLAAAEHEQPSTALGHDLLAAKISYGVLERRPKDQSARSIYNFAVARVVQDVDRTDLEPWRHPVAVVTDEGRYTLVSPKPVDADHDPSRYDLFPSDTLKIGGKFFETYSTVSGVGAPIAVVGRTEAPHFRQQYKYRRIYAPITAIVRFSGRQARLEFIDPLNTKKITLNKKVFSLAADFDAPTALLIARERPERLGLSRVMNPATYANTAMLCRLQQFDPARTPVVFVHGLQETGASWAPMIDSLRDDPWVREHYQFWFFSYPSGYPYPYAAALFRQDLDGIKRAFPNHKRMVLIGHSMGGLLCRLMITDTGDKIWRAFFATSPTKTPLALDTRKLLEEALVFNHRPDVQRVIFISTPHRGSDLASNWIGRIGAALVRTPRLFASTYAATKPLLIADPAARPLNRMPNSVDTLEPNDRFVEAVNKLPITPGIPYHSIIGDRGRGDTPNSSDGVVPYWSSHLPGAQSELIVNSDHGAQYNPEAIREVKRILKLNLSHSVVSSSRSNRSVTVR